MLPIGNIKMAEKPHKPNMPDFLKSKPLSPVHSLLADSIKSTPQNFGFKPEAPSGLNKLLNPTHTSITESIAKSVDIKVPTHLGLLIRSSRVAKKLTQQQLADLSGVGRRFIVECEAGKPRLEFAKVLQVAAAVGIDIFAIKR